MGDMSDHQLHLVLSGSGAKISGFVGAIRALHDNIPAFYERLRTVVGTSGGAIIACLLVIGYTPAEMKDIVLDLTFRSLMDINIDNLVRRFGLDDGKKFVNFFKSILRIKCGDADVSFGGLLDCTSRDLVITGTNISKMRSEIFSAGRTPDMKVWMALRISISLPFLYTACQFRGDYFIDGGVMAQFPVSALYSFGRDIGRYDDVYGLNLVMDDLSNDINDFTSYILALAKTTVLAANSQTGSHNNIYKCIQQIDIVMPIREIYDLEVSRSDATDMIATGGRCVDSYISDSEHVSKAMCNSIFHKLCGRTK